MFLLLKITAIQIAWLGCLPIYLTSEQQSLLSRPMAKVQAWVLFALTAVLSTVMLSFLYHPVAASLIVLCVFMAAWIILALWVPYSGKAKVVIPTCSALMLLISVMGGAHVG